MTPVQQFKGMTVEAATVLAKQMGYEVSVERYDGGPQPLNCEYRPGRVTLHVTNGLVDSAKMG